MDVVVIKKQIIVGQGPHKKQINVLTGFIKAIDLYNLHDVPSILKSDSYEEIADRIVKNNVTKWQRPEIPSKIRAIMSLYNNEANPDANFMVNPVLLTENFDSEEKKLFDVPEIYPNEDIYMLKVLSKNKPFWVIDGQHRVKGMGQSPQKDNFIPFVLIIDDRHYANNTSYSDEMPLSGLDKEFAGKLFAEVNTTTKGIEDVHKVWLAYHFKFNTIIKGREFKFNLSDSDSRSWRKSFETILQLTTVNSAFKDEVDFNEYNTSKSPGPRNKFNTKHPFGFTNWELCLLIYKYYYGAADRLGLIAGFTPTDLREQFLFYFEGLELVLKSPNNVFLGQTNVKNGGKKIMYRPYVGVFLKKIKKEEKSGMPSMKSSRDVQIFLNTLEFNKSNWDFSWVRSHITADERLAFYILNESFDKKGLISNKTKANIQIPDYLQGKYNTGSVDFVIGKKKYDPSPTLTNVVNDPSSSPVLITVNKKQRYLIINDLKNTKGLSFRFEKVNGRHVSKTKAIPLSKGLMWNATHFENALSSTASTYSLNVDPLIDKVEFSLTFIHFGNKEIDVDIVIEWI